MNDCGSSASQKSTRIVLNGAPTHVDLRMGSENTVDIIDVDLLVAADGTTSFIRNFLFNASFRSSVNFSSEVQDEKVSNVSSSEGDHLLAYRGYRVFRGHSICQSANSPESASATFSESQTISNIER